MIGRTCLFGFACFREFCEVGVALKGGVHKIVWFFDGLKMNVALQNGRSGLMLY